jgi:hypothetical protein
VEGGQRTGKREVGAMGSNRLLDALNDFDFSTNPIFVLTHNYFVEKASF